MTLPESVGVNADLQTCAFCGSPIIVGKKHPVYTVESSGGDVALYTFCNTGCKDAWLREH